MSEQDWQELLHKALQGDSDAFGKIYHEHLQTELLRQALKILKDRQQAEDVVQDVFLYLFEEQRYLNIRTTSLKAFETYLFRTVRHRSLDELKRQKVTRFLINTDTLDRLKHASIPDDVLMLLHTMRQEKPVGKTRFLTLLKKVLGERLTRTLETQLLQYSQQETPYTVALSETRLQMQTARTEVLEKDQYLAEKELQHLFLAIEKKIGSLTWQLLEQKYHQGRTYRDISEESGIPITTLQARCQKSLETIRGDEELYQYWRKYVELSNEDEL